jgi:hypothetical protein
MINLCSLLIYVSVLILKGIRTILILVSYISIVESSIFNNINQNYKNFILYIIFFILFRNVQFEKFPSKYNAY